MYYAQAVSAFSPARPSRSASRTISSSETPNAFATPAGVNLSTPVAISAFGPNGEDNGGRNPENGGNKTTDDVTSW